MIWKIYSVYTSMGQILGNIFIPPDGKNERIREIYRVKFWRPFGFSRKYKKRPAISWLTSKGPVLESEHYATHCFFFIADYPTIKLFR